MGLTIDTVRQHIEERYAIMAHCYPCRRSVKVDLAALLPRHADTPVRRLRLICRVCGQVGQRTMHVPHRFMGS